MKTINLTVSEEYVAGAGIIAGAMGSADSTTIHVTFEDWDGLSKYATTRNSRGESATVTALTTDKLVDGTTNEYEFTIPSSAMAYEGQMTVTFTGYEVVNGNEVSTVTNTATAYLRVLPSDWASADDNSITPTLYEQLQAEIDDIIEDISDARTAATEAAESASSASSSATSASNSATSAETSATNASTSATNAATSATNASASESAAGTYASNASSSASNASTSESNAHTYATSSQSYAVGGTGTREGEDTDNAKYYSQSASGSASTATTKASEASTSASSASTSATSASGSASTATTKASEASTSATTSRSYAVGDTETRQGEATDNAHYYYEQCKTMVESLNEGLVPSGTLTFENLPSLSVAVTGAMYNVSNEFTTTSDFEEGAGRVIPAGTNIYKTNNNKWDVLAGSPVTGIKGDAELDYRRGNVNITKGNIGLGNVDNTSDNAKSTAMGTFTSSDDTATTTWISQNKFESDTVSNNFGELSKTVNNTRYLKGRFDNLSADEVAYDHSDSTLSATDTKGAIDELDTDKVNRRLKTTGIYSSNRSFDSKDDRLYVIGDLYNDYTYDTPEEITVLVTFYGDVKVKYKFTHIVYGTNLENLRINVEEICEEKGTYRHYTKLNSGSFAETFVWNDDILSFKTFTATLATPPSGLTIAGSPTITVNPYFIRLDTLTRLNDTNSTITWSPDFSITSGSTTRYYMIMAQYGTDAEEYYSHVSNDTIIQSGINELYIISGELYKSAGLVIVKHNNHIYLAFRNSNATGLSIAANTRTILLGNMQAAIYGELD